MMTMMQSANSHHLNPATCTHCQSSWPCFECGYLWKPTNDRLQTWSWTLLNVRLLEKYGCIWIMEHDKYLKSNYVSIMWTNLDCSFANHLALSRVPNEDNSTLHWSVWRERLSFETNMLWTPRVNYLSLSLTELSVTDRATSSSPARSTILIRPSKSQIYAYVTCCSSASNTWT